MLFAQTRGTAWLLYLLLFLETIFWALFEPGRNAVIPNITSHSRRRDVGGQRAVLDYMEFISFPRIGYRRTVGRRLWHDMPYSSSTLSRLSLQRC